MEFLIQEIKPEDDAAVAAMIRAVFEEYEAPKEGTVYTDPTTDHLSTLFQKESSVLFVAKNKAGEIAGCCGIFPTQGLPNDCAELVKYYVSGAARGKGLGRELMKRSVKAAREMGYKQLYIESLPAYRYAVRIYEKQGFRHLTTPLGNSGHPGCDIWMLKDL